MRLNDGPRSAIDWHGASSTLQISVFKENTVSKDRDQSSKKGLSRRSALRTIASAVPLAAAGGALAGIAAGHPASNTQLKQSSAVRDYTLAFNKLKLLTEDAKSRTQYLAMVDEVVGAMVKDGHIAAQVVTNTDSVLMVNLFNANRKRLEAVVGKVDGRTTEGRYRKIIHATELFEDVSGFDSAGLLHGAEEFGATAELSSSSSSCSGCDAGGSSFLGCCIIHFWGWSASDSGCSPCGDPAPILA